jgi:membrane-associated phospholipid phosphatase
LRLLNLDAALAWSELAAVIARRDPQGPVIPRCDRAQDFDAPLIPLFEFSPEEWSPAERPGTGWLRLFAGFAVLVWVTVLVGIFVVHRGVPGAVNGWDGHVARWMADHRPAWVTAVASLVSVAGSSVVLIVGTIVFGIFVWRRAKRSGPAALAFLVLADTQVIVQITKRIVARPRPAVGLASAGFGGYSWPSDHTSSATAVAVSISLVVATIGCSAVVLRRTRLIAATVAVAVAASRVALGAHWLSDVLMGGIVGATVAVLLAAPLLGHHSSDRPAESRRV